MPKGPVFVRAFHLKEGKLAYGNIDHVSTTHEEIIRFREYLYHITLKVSNVSNKQKLIAEIKERCHGTKIINSDYGNPYKCWIDLDSFKISGDTITLVGHSIRQM